MTLEKEYAQALMIAAQSRRESGLSAQGGKLPLLQNLKEVLRRRRHEKLLPRIFREYEKLLGQRKKRGVKVSFAREQDRKEAFEAAKEFAGDKTVEKEVLLEPSLLSGFVISDAQTRYDTSGKRALLELYKRLAAVRS